jgi:hypothetical protein
MGMAGGHGLGILPTHIGCPLPLTHLESVLRPGQPASRPSAKIHNKVVRLALHAADHRQRLAEVFP